MARGKQDVAGAEKSARQWERYQRKTPGRHGPGLWISVSPRGSVNISRELTQAMGLTGERRGLAIYRWPHDGELVVKIEAVEAARADFCPRATKAGGRHFSSPSFGAWLGLAESRGKRYVFEVSSLDGEFIFTAKAPAAAATTRGAKES